MTKAGRLRVSVTVILTMILSFCTLLVCQAKGANEIEHPQILMLSSYAYDWDSVPYQLRGVASVLGTKSKMDYVFMNTKKHTYDEVKQDVYKEIQQNIVADRQYDLVILEDDAALDFAMEYRNDLFENVPMVFMGVNTAEKANAAHEDPLITGMIEYFPYNDTIALARKIYPDATKIVGISDSTKSGIGCTKRFYDEEKNFPELSFSDMNTTEMTEAEIKQELSSMDESTILVFLSLMNDADGNTYSLLEATDFVAGNASIPVFKADMLGIGEGIFGGYVSSYEEMGKAAAGQALQILSGTSPADIPVGTMGGYPEFDQNKIDEFHIAGNLIPDDAVIVNYVPTFYEQYRVQIWIAGFIFTIMLLLVGVFLLAMAKQKANRKLENALQLAESANSSKSRFLAQMSHEIRTPMNAIIGLTSLSRSHLDEREKMIDYLKKIDGSSKLLLGIINDVLDMSAIESGKLQIGSAQYDFKRAISTLTGIFYQQATQKNIDFNVHLKGVTEEQVVGDELRVNQILMNLLSNAVKFTPAGGKIDLYIIQASMSMNKIYMRFQVSDTGCGMSEEMLGRLFKPFEQESAETARKHGGSGLGMSIAKQLTEKMGGSIQVESKQNAGTTFTVDIPFGACEQVNPPSLNEFSKINVLVVDDDADAREYCGELLDRLGVNHESAQCGEQALNMIGEAEDEGREYQMCMVDWKMPDMDGIQLTKKIREVFGDDNIVIIVSAYDLNEVEEKAIQAGANYFMPKPLFQSTIYNSLQMRKVNFLLIYQF